MDRVDQFMIMLLLAGIPLAPALADADRQIWSTTSATADISKKWSVSQDITTRFSNDRHGVYEVEANTLLGFHLTKSLSLWAGYDHDPQYGGGEFTVIEQRFVQQLAAGNFVRFGGGQLSGRVRLEERWRRGIHATAWRIRPYLRYGLPIDKRTSTAVVVSEELWFDANRSPFQKVRGLERLRTFGGLSIPLAKGVKAEIGYLNQHGFGMTATSTNANVALFSLGLKL